jgi:hypothetical protein
VPRSLSLSRLERVTYESGLVPVYGTRLVGIGIGEAFHLPGLTAKESVKFWTDFVSFTFSEGVALCAAGLVVLVIVEGGEGGGGLL